MHNNAITFRGRRLTARPIPSGEGLPIFEILELIGSKGENFLGLVRECAPGEFRTCRTSFPSLTPAMVLCAKESLAF